MGLLLDELKSKFTDELIEEFAKKIKWKDDLLKIHINKLHSLSVKDRSTFIEKCMVKYTSDKYKDREMFKCGREPQCCLYNLLFEYGLVYGKIWEKDEMFLAGSVIIDDIYGISLYQGQGSFIDVVKLNQ